MNNKNKYLYYMIEKIGKRILRPFLGYKMSIIQKKNLNNVTRKQMEIKNITLK
jgi:hypothetical protein